MGVGVLQRQDRRHDGGRRGERGTEIGRMFGKRAGRMLVAGSAAGERWRGAVHADRVVRVTSHAPGIHQPIVILTTSFYMSRLAYLRSVVDGKKEARCGERARRRSGGFALLPTARARGIIII